MFELGRHIVLPPSAGRIVVPRTAAAAAGPTDWWTVSGKTCVAAYQPKGAASLAASYSNLANPGTYDAAEGTAPTFDAATGWTFNGSTQYLTTGVNPGSGWSALVRFSDCGAGLYVVFGSRASLAMQMAIIPNYSTDAYFYNGDVAVHGTGFTAGVLAVAGNQGYANGTNLGLTIGAWSGTSTYPMLIGAYNNLGTTGLYAPVKVQALAFYSNQLTDGEVATVSAAMAAL